MERFTKFSPLLLCAYPIFETVFTIYRRKVVRVATSQTASTCTRGFIVWTLMESRERRRLTRRNYMTPPCLRLLTSVIPSVLWWNSTAIL